MVRQDREGITFTNSGRFAPGYLGLSARAYDKIRRIARTIADLEGSEGLQLSHVSEAVAYRLLDRKM